MTAEPLTPEEARVRRAHVLVVTGLLVGCAVVYALAVALTAGQLPDPLATHFGVDGRADGWMPLTVALVLQGLLVVGLPGLLLVMMAAGQWWKGGSARLSSSFVAGLAGGLTALFVHLVLLQSGLPDAADARLSPMTLVWAVGAGLLVGLAARAVLPANLPQPPPVVAEPITIAPSDRVSWFGRAVPGRAVAIVLGGTAVVMVVLALVVQNWWFWLIALLMVVLVPATTVFRVTIDGRGLTWRSALGVPRGHLPLAEITGATVVMLRPGDFGGYGVRSAPGATGLVTRSGEALSVSHRRATSDQDRRLVITVDDALTAASVLEGLRRRHR